MNEELRAGEPELRRSSPRTKMRFPAPVRAADPPRPQRTPLGPVFGSHSCGLPQTALHVRDSRVVRWKATHMHLLSSAPKRGWDGTFASSESPSPLQMLQSRSQECNPDQPPREYEQEGNDDAMNSHSIFSSCQSSFEPAARPSVRDRPKGPGILARPDPSAASRGPPRRVADYSGIPRGESRQGTESPLEERRVDSPPRGFNPRLNSLRCASVPLGTEGEAPPSPE